MARRVPKYRRQAQLSQDLKQGLERLRETRRTLRDASNRAFENKPVRLKAPITNADYREMLRLEKRLGLYEPKLKQPWRTPSGRRAIRQHWHQLEYLAENSVFAEYPTGTSKKVKTRIKRDVRRAHPPVEAPGAQFSGEKVNLKRKSLATKKGVFIETERRQIGPVRSKQEFEGKAEKVVEQPLVGRLQFDRETGVWTVRKSRRTKGGLRAEETIYIAGPEVLALKEDKLRKRFGKMPKLKKNQRLRFIIGNNVSRNTFRNMDQLFRYAAGYRKDPVALATFLNELIIEVVQKGPAVYRRVGRKGNKQRRVKDYYMTSVQAFRASNYHEMPIDVVQDMMDDLEEDDDE